MKTNIEEQLNKALESAENYFLGDKKVEEYERTAQNFRKLVEKGVVKERGNNLMSISDSSYFRTRIFFNYAPVSVDDFTFGNSYTFSY